MPIDDPVRYVAELVDFCLQAVDGIKVTGVSRDSLKSRGQIERLLQAADEQITAMEKGQDKEPADGCARAKSHHPELILPLRL